jgi:glucose-6-phosphate 1-dehydrogenase
MVDYPETMTPPTIITIFGATGDLSTNKLIPALFDLFQNGYLPFSFKVIGVSRREFSHEKYRDIAKNSIIEKATSFKEDLLDEFLTHISYTQGTFDDKESYERLKSVLEREEHLFGQCTNKLFYLAVPPVYYKGIFEKLAASGLTKPCSDETGWTRILVEKPFGNDITTAQELDQVLGSLFKEEQIFRIDHYLAKEALQDILMFRFSNTLFEPLWNKDYIERVELTLSEKKGVDGRGAFYDGIGALRDVGQNHLLQMLAFIAMEDPIELDALRIRTERARVLESLRPLTPETADTTLLRGQYEGYTETPSVDRDSQTETFFRIKTLIDNDRWQGVPFYLESGKALDEDKTEIKIYFKKTTSCLCPPGALHQHQNILTFRIQPNEKISILFWAKKPGLSLDLEPKELSFSYRGAEGSRLADAYEKVLFDGIAGDQILFTSTEEVAAAWQFITPILELWKNMPLHTYAKGSKGPQVLL